MLFNSYIFLFAFLPVTWAGYFLLSRRRLTLGANAWMLFASLFFYGWWDIKYVPLILGSILFNYTIGGLMIAHDEQKKTLVSRRALLLAGLAVNLLFLGWFKYTDFFIANLNAVAGTHLPLLKIVLPLGISFFTITQIAFLVDVYEGLVEERKLLNYALFVTFFPHLLAGPILHHKEMMPQFDRTRNKVVNYTHLYLGLCLFFIGLFKKVILADTFAGWSTAGFDLAPQLNFFEAWLASFSYTFQLYFDFSGYSDMAVAIGWMFNIELPINFNSPYKATSIIDFWRRWHITLSNFITTYLYTPMVRSFKRITFGKSMAAIFIAMFISGVWHGAGWTFIIWGTLHGAALVVNHWWRKFKIKMPPVLAWLLTFGFVNLAFVFFRAKSLDAAWKVFKGMLGLNGVMLHHSLGKHPLVAKLSGVGVSFGSWLTNIGGSDQTYIYALCGFAIVLWAPNSMQLVERVRPTWRWLLALMVVACWALLELGKVSEFLYFQF